MNMCFFGQAKPGEIPVWAMGYQWYYDKLAIESFTEQAWDFGLHGDAIMYRKVAKLDDRLFERLKNRREHLRGSAVVVDV